jgi:hypothetical protein
VGKQLLPVQLRQLLNTLLLRVAVAVRMVLVERVGI